MISQTFWEAWCDKVDFLSCNINQADDEMSDSKDWRLCQVGLLEFHCGRFSRWNSDKVDVEVAIPLLSSVLNVLSEKL